jgi:hypothetical protein
LLHWTAETIDSNTVNESSYKVRKTVGRIHQPNVCVTQPIFFLCGGVGEKRKRKDTREIESRSMRGEEKGGRGERREHEKEKRIRGETMNEELEAETKCRRKKKNQVLT